MSEITKQDLIDANDKIIIFMIFGFIIGVFTIAATIMATYPEKNTCVMEQYDEL